MFDDPIAFVLFKFEATLIELPHQSRCIFESLSHWCKRRAVCGEGGLIPGEGSHVSLGGCDDWSENHQTQYYRIFFDTVLFFSRSVTTSVSVATVVTVPNRASSYLIYQLRSKPLRISSIFVANNWSSNFKFPHMNASICIDRCQGAVAWLPLQTTDSLLSLIHIWRCRRLE